MNNLAQRQPNRPVESLTAFGILIIIGVGLSVIFRFTRWGLPCLFHYLTGWDCPFCGATRMGAALLRGDLVAAWHSNAFVLVIIVLLAVRSLGWIIELIRHPDHGNRWLGQWIAHNSVPIWFGIGIAWTLFRNLI